MSGWITEEQARALFNEHAQYVHKTVYILTKSNAIADDITQETFIRAFQNFQQFDESKPIRPWLYKIAVNLTRNHYRKRNVLLVPEVPDTFIDGVEPQVIESEEKRALWNEINQLPPKMREVVVLRFFEELSMPEVADILGIPLGTCKSRLNSALTRLRKKCGDVPLNFQLNGGN